MGEVAGTLATYYGSRKPERRKLLQPEALCAYKHSGVHSFSNETAPFLIDEKRSSKHGMPPRDPCMYVLVCGSVAS